MALTDKERLVIKWQNTQNLIAEFEESKLHDSTVNYANAATLAELKRKALTLRLLFRLRYNEAIKDHPYVTYRLTDI